MLTEDIKTQLNDAYLVLEECWQLQQRTSGAAKVQNFIVGEKLRCLRRRAGFSKPSNAAKHLKLKVKAYLALENGRITPVNVQLFHQVVGELEKIAK